MGAVEMYRGNEIRYNGGYISTIEKCVYCDKCGSFKILHLPTCGTLIWITTVTIIAVMFVINIKTNVGVLVGILGLSVLLSVLTKFGAFKLGYLCRKCLNSHITEGNALNYRERDSSILDIPYESTVKIYIASDNE